MDRFVLTNGLLPGDAKLADFWTESHMGQQFRRLNRDEIADTENVGNHYEFSGRPVSYAGLESTPL